MSRVAPDFQRVDASLQDSKKAEKILKANGLRNELQEIRKSIEVTTTASRVVKLTVVRLLFWEVCLDATLQGRSLFASKSKTLPIE